jgi:hypothetical protein
MLTRAEKGLSSGGSIYLWKENDMSRTVVVFHLPSNQLVYLELSDLSGKPVENTNLVLDGNRYRVVDVTESIGVFKADGSKLSGMEKLLEISAVLFENDALTLLANLRNIGSGDQPEVKGGVIIPNSKLIGDFDNVVVVRLKASSGRVVTASALGDLVKAFYSQTGGELPATTNGSPAVPPMIIGDAAASE